MIQLILIDTDILIDVARNVQPAIDALENLNKTYQIAISSVTEMELIVGCKNKSELRKLEKFLQYFTIVPIDRQITETAVKFLKKYHLSHNLLIADALIAATAIVFDIDFISKNQRDFKYINALKLLKYPL